jgi:hypothetical protein
MRSDLNKQLCERERHRSYDRYGNYRHLRKFNRTGDEELSGLPTREGMKHRYVNGWNTKDLNENLNPLWGAVRKNVGRRWDAFYSDICKVFDKRSVVNQHILDHLFQEVEREVYVGDDDKLYVRSRYGRGDTLLRDSYTEYYVDPRDGILKINKHYRTSSEVNRQRAAEKRREEAKVFRQLDENTVLRNVDGVWYEYEMKPYPVGHYKITKPLGVDVFKVYGREKDWESMSEAERNKYGVKTYVGESAYDVFTKTSVRIDEWIARRMQHENHRRKAGKNTIVAQYAERKYHATRKTASKKTLRDAGITE